MTLHSSRDGGVTWDKVLVWPEFSGYSALVVLEEQTSRGSMLGLLFEYDKTEKASGTIGFTRLLVDQDNATAAPLGQALGSGAVNGVVQEKGTVGRPLEQDIFV